MKGTLLGLGAARLTAAALCSLVVAAGTGILPVAGLTGSVEGSATPPPVTTTTPVTAGPLGPPAPVVTGQPRARVQASQAGVTLTGTLSQSQLVRGSDGQLYLHCGVEVSEDAGAITERRPIDLALVLDTSGSMSGAMPLLKQATRGIVERLGAQDRLTVVTYSNGAQVVFRGLMDAAGRESLEAAVAGLVAAGGTNISAGLEAARDALRAAPIGCYGGRDEPLRRRSCVPEEPTPHVHLSSLPGQCCSDEPSDAFAGERAQRVLLLTDGLANQGVSDPAGLCRIVADLRGRGVALSALGLGVQYNEDLLSGMAETGGGLYHYADRAERLAAVYKAEIEALQGLVAQSAELELRPRDGVTIEEVFSWTARAEGGARVISLGDLARGRQLKIVARIRVADGQELTDAVDVALSFKDAVEKTPQRLAPETLTVAWTGDAELARQSVRNELVPELKKVQVAQKLEEARALAKLGRVEEARNAVLECEGIAGEADMEYSAPSGVEQSLNFRELADGIGAGPSSERGRAAMKASLSGSQAAGR